MKMKMKLKRKKVGDEWKIRWKMKRKKKGIKLSNCNTKKNTKERRPTYEIEKKWDKKKRRGRRRSHGI